MKERGGSEAVRMNNLDKMIRPGSILVNGELMFQIERPVLNARAGYYEAVEVDGWEEKPAATLIREVIPETRAAAD